MQNTEYGIRNTEYRSLRPGMTIGQAQANVETIAATLAQQYPKEDGGVSGRVVPLLVDLTDIRLQSPNLRGRAVNS